MRRFSRVSKRGRHTDIGFREKNELGFYGEESELLLTIIGLRRLFDGVISFSVERTFS